MYICREEYFHVATYKEYDKRREKGSKINVRYRINESTNRAIGVQHEGKGGTGGRDRNGGWRSRTGGMRLALIF